MTVIDTTTGDTAINLVLQGSFRIVDNAGYEYRANPLGIRPVGCTTDSFGFSYDSLGSPTFADVVGIPVKWTESGFGIPQAEPNIVAKLDPFNVDENEVIFSCNSRVFSCSAAGMNVVINTIIIHSKGGANMCLTSINTGILNLERPVVSGEVIPESKLNGYMVVNEGGIYHNQTELVHGKGICLVVKG